MIVQMLYNNIPPHTVLHQYSRALFCCSNTHDIAQVKNVLFNFIPDRGIIAFRVSSPTASTYSSSSVITFSDVQLNVGDAYDVNTGKFTAPVSGLYIFTSQLCVNKGQHVYIEIAKNENALQRSIVFTSGSTYQCCNADAFDVLAQGDTVSLRTPPSAGSMTTIYRSDTILWSSFSGALLVWTVLLHFHMMDMTWPDVLCTICCISYCFFNVHA